VHHSKKTRGEETQVEDARGASALMNVMRAARALTRMTSAEGKRLGVEADYWKYFRLSGVSKTSRAPQTGPGGDNVEWLTAASVSLGNGSGTALDATLYGDSVGVVTCANFTEQAKAVVKVEKLDEILAAIRGAEWRDDVRAAAWVGKAVANVLGLDPSGDGGDRPQIQSVLTTLRRLNRIKSFSKMAEGSKIKTFIQVIDAPSGTDEVVEGDNLSAQPGIFG
jgi:hypothetical protein